MGLSLSVSTTTMPPGTLYPGTLAAFVGVLVQEQPGVGELDSSRRDKGSQRASLALS